MRNALPGQNPIMKICILGSGSSGNCVFVSSDSTRVLIDAGLSAKEVERRLDLIGVRPETLTGLCVTHEHDDHKSAIGTLHRRHKLSLYANSGTLQALEADDKLKGLAWSVFETGRPFQIGDLQIEPFSVPHDSYDPVGFAITCGASRVGIVTDMGMATTLIRERLKNCHVLVLESNHDEDLLKNSTRPWSLKQRIAGNQGHLSNRQAGELMLEVAGPQLRCIFLAHLSSDCNRPELALKAARRTLDGADLKQVEVRLTFSDRISDIVEF